MAQRQMTDLLREGRQFSFLLGGKNAWETEYRQEQTETGNVFTSSYWFEGGLKVTNVARFFPEHGAVEWVNWFENTSGRPTPILSRIWDCHWSIPLGSEQASDKTSDTAPPVEMATKVYAPNGSTWSAYEFYCDVDAVEDRRRHNHIEPGETMTYRASGGRSSEKQAPYFNIYKAGRGCICAIGWSGQWLAEISRENETVTIRSGIEDSHFRLMPGEKLRTSSVVLLPYECNVVDAHNKWRRLLKAEFAHVGTPGRDVFAPLTLNVWGGMPSEKVIQRIQLAKDKGMPFEYLWMDAGWYGQNTPISQNAFQSDWIRARGDWSVSPIIHPNGLEDVSRAAQEAGLKFLLWFELERANPNSPLVSEHPEYFLSGNHPMANKLFNLGDPAAWQACYDILAGHFEKLNIRGYRIDFNDSPLPYWRRKDDPDRVGITEIKYITGLYRLFDALLERFPDLLIDNCASGGRRLDIEMQRRGVSLWRSDYQCTANYDIEVSQCHTMTYSAWMPYSGTCPGSKMDLYRFRSSYASSLAIGNVNEKAPLDTLDTWLREYLRARPYFSEDFYPLCEVSAKPDTWCAYQFDRPSQKDGILQIFRREKSPYETAVYTLGGINENACYLFEDADGGEFAVSGRTLAEDGLRLTLPQKRTAKLYFYKVIE